MAQSASMKGYGPEYHIFSICFFLSIWGILYTISLPDLNMQNKMDALIDAVKNNNVSTNKPSAEQAYSDLITSLPDL